MVHHLRRLRQPWQAACLLHGRLLQMCRGRHQQRRLVVQLLRQRGLLRLLRWGLTRALAGVGGRLKGCERLAVQRALVGASRPGHAGTSRSVQGSALWRHPRRCRHPTIATRHAAPRARPEGWWHGLLLAGPFAGVGRRLQQAHGSGWRLGG